MGLTNPWESRVTAWDKHTEQLPTRRPEPEPSPDRAPAREEASASGQVFTFPGSGASTSTEVAERDRVGWLPRARELGTAWYADAKDTGTAALDGSVYRARPPALRDQHARIVRAEWAGDVGALRVAGQVVGALCLAINALLYAAAWATRRPVRLAVTVVLVTVQLVWGWPL